MVNISIEDKLKNLFAEWKRKEKRTVVCHDKDTTFEIEINHDGVFIEDGIVNYEKWNGGKKILFLLKEAYGEDDDWSLTQWLYEMSPSSNLWYRVVEWTYGITNTTSSEIAKYEPNKISFSHGKKTPNEWISQIAVVNLKKSGGRSSSNYSEIDAYAHYDAKEILKEIEYIDPDIVVCGATLSSLDSICDNKICSKHNDNWFYYSDVIGDRERLFLDYYHPANRYPALLNYYGIVNIYQQAIKAKENA